MQRIVLFVTLSILLFSLSVDAHAWMSSPLPRGQYTNPKKYAFQEYAPVAGNTPLSQEFVCRNDPVMPVQNWLSLSAGGSQNIYITYNALHVGDCFVYLTYDGDKPENQMKWFKIWQEQNCQKQPSYNIPIPSYLPSGEHVIFRWEWYALHVPNSVEYYTQCVDAVLTGSSNGALPQPLVSIPGHLPPYSGDYSIGSNNYWYAYGSQTPFFTGPPVASLGGNNPTTTPTNPTVAPTVAPTVSPTVVPSVAPTYSPTGSPTVSPTISPTVSPSVAPTQPPSSVQLVVNANAWWFSCYVAGATVSKIEFKDSFAFPSLQLMEKASWDTITWVFFRNVEFIAPITIKATLTSGASVSFKVDSFAPPQPLNPV